jgi:hypothetical protein
VPDVVDADGGLRAADVDVGDARDVDVRAGWGMRRESWRTCIERWTEMVSSFFPPSSFLSSFLLLVSLTYRSPPPTYTHTRSLSLF